MARTLEEIQNAYRARLILSEFPEGDSPVFMTQAKTMVVAWGYERVVIGKRGPYVEFLDEHMNQKALFVPPDQMWRFHADACYYYELRTRDSCRVKIYLQKRSVDYADYRPGRWYISPFDLITDRHPVLVEPLKRKKNDQDLQEDAGRDRHAVRPEDGRSQEDAERPAPAPGETPESGRDDSQARGGESGGREG